MKPSPRPDDTANLHLVQFYEGAAFLLDELTRFVGVGLGAGEAVIVIATADHVEAAKETLILEPAK